MCRPIKFYRVLKVAIVICSCLVASLAQVNTSLNSNSADRNPAPAKRVDNGSNANATRRNSNEPKDDSQSEEAAAILPYYNNYLKEYHLGPEDVISVEVFGQPNYSKSGIAVPPNARISYPLIPGGVFVGGKTVDQVSADIRRRLDEYIIDPQVTVTLDKVGSARFSVLGKVASPGVKVMARRYNLLEAISEAGGIEKLGDKKRILLVRLRSGGGFEQTTYDMEKIMSGKTEIPYLVPGDQIIVPEKGWSLSKVLNILGSASSLRVLFGVPF